MKWSTCLIPLFGLVAACGSDKTPQSATGAPAVGGAVAMTVDTSVLARLGDASAFETAAAKPYGAVACARGEVEGLDVLVCHYEDAAAAAANTAQREFVAGALSGLVRAVGSDVIAIADRKEVDPKGEKISSVISSFDPKP